MIGWEDLEDDLSTAIKDTQKLSESTLEKFRFLKKELGYFKDEQTANIAKVLNEIRQETKAAIIE